MDTDVSQVYRECLTLAGAKLVDTHLLRDQWFARIRKGRRLWYATVDVGGRAHPEGESYGPYLGAVMRVLVASTHLTGTDTPHHCLERHPLECDICRDIEGVMRDWGKHCLLATFSRREMFGTFPPKQRQNSWFTPEEYVAFREWLGRPWRKRREG